MSESQLTGKRTRTEAMRARFLLVLLFSATLGYASAQEAPVSSAAAGKPSKVSEPALQTPGQLGISLKDPPPEETQATEAKTDSTKTHASVSSDVIHSIPPPPDPNNLQGSPWVKPVADPGTDYVTPLGFMGRGEMLPQFVPEPIVPPQPLVPQAPAFNPMSALLSNPIFLMQMMGGDMPDPPSPSSRSSMRPGGGSPMATMRKMMMIQRMKQEQIDRINRNDQWSRMGGEHAPSSPFLPPPPSSPPSFPTPLPPFLRPTSEPASQPPPVGPQTRTFGPPANLVNRGGPGGPTPFMRPNSPPGSDPPVPRNLRQLSSNPGFQRMLRTSATRPGGLPGTASVADRRADQADLMTDYMDMMGSMGPLGMMMGGGPAGMMARMSGGMSGMPGSPMSGLMSAMMPGMSGGAMPGMPGGMMSGGMVPSLMTGMGGDMGSMMAMMSLFGGM